jgi:trimethylamine:corrinoid methyltransferase-like protein
MNKVVSLIACHYCSTVEAAQHDRDLDLIVNAITASSRFYENVLSTRERCMK